MSVGACGLFLLLVAALVSPSAAVRQCSSAHCSGADNELNDVCKKEGWPVNHPVLTRDSQGPCVCSCSCLAFGTKVATGKETDVSIELFKSGDTVLAAGPNLDWKPLTVDYSGGTTGVSRQKYAVLVLFDKGYIVTTSDHLFLLANKELKRACLLTTSDKLTGRGGSTVNIVSVHIGDYLTGFHHISTSAPTPTSTSYDGHLLITNNVVSADFALQRAYGEKRSLHASFVAEEPVIGSKAYREKWGDGCLQLPKRDKHIASHALDIALAEVNPPHDISKYSHTFVPAAITAVSIPPGATSFISEEDALAKESDPSRPWNDPHSREWTEYLLDQYHHFYDQITFQLDWQSDQVNAFAWVESGRRYVAIKGGLVRHNAIGLEGTALVIAHEIGHHYGGRPLFPSGLSCEGQADFAAASVIMRKVWFGEDYVNKMLPAIAQMADFFGAPNTDSPNPPPQPSTSCDHPPGNCRIPTYYAALDLKPKPPCAGRPQSASISPRHGSGATVVPDDHREDL